MRALAIGRRGCSRSPAVTRRARARRGRCWSPSTCPPAPTRSSTWCSIDGVATAAQSVTLPSSALTSGTLELDFSAYPAGSTVTVTVTALGGRQRAGVGHERSARARRRMRHHQRERDGDGDRRRRRRRSRGRRSRGRRPGADRRRLHADRRLPDGRSVRHHQRQLHHHVQRRAAVQRRLLQRRHLRHRRRADGVRARPGRCGSCVGNANGTACLTLSGTVVCGCNSATDCPANRACDTATHTCTVNCDSTTPCNGGCCSAMTGGTCQTGTATMICGNNGDICAATARAIRTASKCVAVTGGGQCGCDVADRRQRPGGLPGHVDVVHRGPLRQHLLGDGDRAARAAARRRPAGPASPALRRWCAAPSAACAPSCVGDANGTACLSSGVCGCNSGQRLPRQSGVRQHAAQAARARATPTQPCHGGCCSSAGSCVVGTATGSCGSSGGTCAVCPANADLRQLQLQRHQLRH